MEWEEEALRRLERVHPQMREMARFRIEEFARKQGYERITADVMDERYSSWGEKGGETTFNPQLQWDEEAKQRVLRAPKFVQPSLVKEIEAHAINRGIRRITEKVIGEAKAKWGDFNTFHESFDPKEREKG